jgi:hypothetical protein
LLLHSQVQKAQRTTADSLKEEKQKQKQASSSGGGAQGGVVFVSRADHEREVAKVAALQKEKQGLWLRAGRAEAAATERAAELVTG